MVGNPLFLGTWFLINEIERENIDDDMIFLAPITMIIDTFTCIPVWISIGVGYGFYKLGKTIGDKIEIKYKIPCEKCHKKEKYRFFKKKCNDCKQGKELINKTDLKRKLTEIQNNKEQIVVYTKENKIISGNDNDDNIPTYKEINEYNIF